MYNHSLLGDLPLKCQSVYHPLECLVVKTSNKIINNSNLYTQTHIIAMPSDHSPTSSICYRLPHVSHSQFAQSTKQTGPSCTPSLQPDMKHFTSCLFAEMVISSNDLQLNTWQLQVQPKGEPLGYTCYLIKNT